MPRLVAVLSVTTFCTFHREFSPGLHAPLVVKTIERNSWYDNTIITVPSTFDIAGRWGYLAFPDFTSMESARHTKTSAHLSVSESNGLPSL